MRRIKVTPTDDFPIPYSTDDEVLKNFADELFVTANTAEFLEEIGAPIEVTTADAREEKKLLDAAIRDKKVAPLTKSLPAAIGAASLLRTYGQQVAADVAVVRNALTHKLLEIADCGDTKYELKAIELLGKHSDIGLFTERSEINVNYNTADGLENAIKERVKRLLNADAVELGTFAMDLDTELGIHDADFEEVHEAVQASLRPSEEEEDE